MSLHLPVLVQYDITYKRINSLYKCLIWHAETHPLPFFYTTIKNEKNCHVSYNSAWFLQYGFTYMMHKIDKSISIRVAADDTFRHFQLIYEYVEAIYLYRDYKQRLLVAFSCVLFRVRLQVVPITWVVNKKLTSWNMFLTGKN